VGSIALPFIPDNVRTVLRWGISDISPHSHAEIANWCERFWNTYHDVDSSEDIDRVMGTLADVECQWDMFLAAELARIPGIDPNSVRAPMEWFVQWNEELDV